MITYTTGNLLDATVDALVNTVNCVGVMGRGMALQFKHAFPDNFKAYASACRRKEVEPGRMFVFDTGKPTAPRYVVNFPTKRHWRGKSRMEDIDAGLAALAADIRRLGIRSIAIPALGSGLGGLDWLEVKQRIEGALGELHGVDVIVYEPHTTLDHGTVRSSAVPQMTAGRAALISLMGRYLGGLMDPSVSLLEVHKLMYFLQSAGEPLRLKYVEGPYGPYAENLRHVLQKIEGHFVSGYADGGDAPDKQLSILPHALSEAETYLSAHRDTQARFERVSRLVEGFETAFGLELLATVHWVVEQRHASDCAAIERETYAWGPRKRQFSPGQLGLATQRLHAEGWIAEPRGS